MPPEKQPIISIIVPCYNYGHYLDEALSSVLANGFDDWECLIVDDGSSDDSRAVASKWEKKDARFRLLAQANGGVSAARNLGIDAARGAFVQFLDADDLLGREKLATHLEYLQTHPNCDVVFGPWSYLSGDDLSAPFPVAAPAPDFAAFLKSNAFVIHAALLRAPVARLKFDVQLASQEDWDLWLRAANDGFRFEFCASRAGSVVARTHGDSLSHQTPTTYRSILRLRAKIECLPIGKDLRRLNRRMSADVESGYAIHLAKHGELGRANRHLWRLARRGYPRYAFFALALPLLRLSWGQCLVRRIRKKVFKPL